MRLMVVVVVNARRDPRLKVKVIAHIVYVSFLPLVNSGNKTRVIMRAGAYRVGAGDFAL